MSVAALHRAGRLADAVGAAQVVVGDAAAVSPRSVGQAELVASFAAVVELEAQVAALRLALLTEVESREVATREAATGTDAWAAALTSSDRAVMAGGLWLGRLLQNRYEHTRAALAAGRIGEAQARVIVGAAERLPEGLDETERDAAEAHLVEQAASGVDPRRLRMRARRMAEVVSRRLADQHEAALLGQEERRAERETWLTVQDRGDGTWLGRFCVPELSARILVTLLEQLTSPRRHPRDAAGRPVSDPTMADTPTGHGGFSRSEQFGQAFCELLEHLPRGTGDDASGRSGADPATAGYGASAITDISLLVHLDYQHLLDGLGAARLDTGAVISAGEARRLACNAGIIPAVLGGSSEPLDLGRERRLHTRTQRRALSLRHDSCAAAGCQRPFAWCEIHHPHAWSHGGRTDLRNAVPLCGWHHRRAHDDRYHVTLSAGGVAHFHRRT